EEAVDTVAETAGLEVRGCATESLRLHGYDPSAGLEAGLPDTRRMYGTDRAELDRIERADRFHAAPMHPALSITQSEVIFAARTEMARSVEDVLARRTRSLLLDAHAASEIADETARLMGRELGWTTAECASSAAEFRELARGYLPA
ncbi:MAG: glycerol-3-phosphate dehydrogenase C-terminal domain-containing protein, partial [bacterium]